jgi:hypothetical protein
MKRIRITGLVRLMNQVRDILSTGIPPGEEDNFRKMVQAALRQVDAICKEHKTSPDKLPSPTYRAYRYLKELDLKELPVAKEALPANPGRLQVRNLISSCRIIQEQLADLASLENQLPESKTDVILGMAVLRNQIHALAESVKAAIKSARSNESSLSNPARRAYRWVRYLSNEAHLVAHIITLQKIQAEIAHLKNSSPVLKSRLKGSISFELTNMRALYNVKQGKEGIRVQAHEGFVGAPDEILQALVVTTLSGKRALDRKGKAYPDIVKDYTHSEAFQRIASQLEFERTPTDKGSRGQYFDLEDIFNKVNRLYFEGAMSKPNLTWNKTLTHRKFGHYHAASDTVMLSISLDQASIPAYVLEFVMYHELLHKQLGISNHKGRQYAHTPAFREAEARFKKHKQAEMALNELRRELMKGKS